MNETIFLGGCPVIRPEGIYLNGERVIRLGLQGIGDVGDLFAYRKMWEPFIKAHLDLWRNLNEWFETAERDGPWTDLKKPCPPGISTDAQIPNMPWTRGKEWCSALSLTRMMISTTSPDGILPRWNAWAGKSSAQILAGASDMLKWQQDVVLQVSGPDRNRLVEIAKRWDVGEIQLPDLPTFNAQQELIARIEGAFTSTKGILQIIGYGAGEVIKTAGDVTQAVAQGLTDTAKELPKTTKWIGIAAVVAAVVVGGALIVYYIPRRTSPSPSLGPSTGDRI